MPGILPMKLIKCGNAQTRIAQACDRCRSKKIRCDGIRPCCTQCANVGFECKTSDKLSRRAFPRGYTESLEERVRALEAEVRDLKTLLDAKDEQLDMLSRIHSFSPYTPPATTTSTGVGRRQQPFGGSPREAKEETFAIIEKPSLMGSTDKDGYIMGASSGRPFLELFKRKLLNSRRFEQPFSTDVFLTQPSHIAALSSLSLGSDSEPSTKPPPRLLSDHLLISFVQEYHPLFPVLHWPALLKNYERLMKGVEAGKAGNGMPKHALAQLFLVFAIASEQTDARDTAQQQSYDSQWQRALDSIIMEPTLETLQCLVLAQLYCFAKGDYSRLSQYKSLAIGICLRLGLHQSQKKFGLSDLTCEMRKRVFWCAATLDSFSAAMLGQPKLLNDNLIETEYPADIDDEYVTDKDGFLQPAPGDSTKISSALALFRIGVTIGRIVENVYAPGMRASQKVLRELEEELDLWKQSLAPHLRLEFVNGMPATNVVHSRSPFLVLAYHYGRTLIHRSVIGTGLNMESASAHTIAESSKCIIQIIQLLTERKLGFSFCLNRNQLLAFCGITIMYSALDYQRDGGLRKDSQKLVTAVVEELEKEHSFVAKQFRLIAGKVMPINSPVMDRRESISSGGALDFSASPSSTSSHDDMLSAHGGSPTFRHIPVNLTPREPNKTIRRSSSQDISAAQVRALQRPPAHRLTSASMTDLSPAALQYNMKMQNASPLVGNVELYDTATWPVDASQPPDEWTQLVSMLDANGAAHVYGEFIPGGGLVPVPQAEWSGPNGMMNAAGLSTSFFQEFSEDASAGSLSHTESDGEHHFPGDENDILWATSAA